jgi:regulation of enolase protein 1 (concanavalin A-like superfamily)
VNYDIGTVSPKGSFFYGYGIHTSKGAGVASINATTDAFNYTYDKLTGDGSITAKVTSMSNSNAWARAGVMIRDGTAANAKSVAVLMTPSNGVNLQWRATAGAVASNTKVTGKVAPYWVKLVRAGNVFTGYYSADGATWTAYATKTVAMNSDVYIGLAVTSNVSGTLCTATFEKVNMTGNITILP